MLGSCTSCVVCVFFNGFSFLSAPSGGSFAPVAGVFYQKIYCFLSAKSLLIVLFCRCLGCPVYQILLYLFMFAGLFLAVCANKRKFTGGGVAKRTKNFSLYPGKCRAFHAPQRSILPVVPTTFSGWGVVCALCTLPPGSCPLYSL